MNPLLLCEGTCNHDVHVQSRYTEHRKVRTEWRVPLIPSEKRPNEKALHEIFACVACGAERVYGCS
jgi:hypothetical protein